MTIAEELAQAAETVYVENQAAFVKTIRCDDLDVIPVRFSGTLKDTSTVWIASLLSVDRSAWRFQVKYEVALFEWPKWFSERGEESPGQAKIRRVTDGKSEIHA